MSNRRPNKRGRGGGSRGGGSRGGGAPPGAGGGAPGARPAAAPSRPFDSRECMGFILENLIGCQVDVQVRGGKWMRGLLSQTKRDANGLSLTLLEARDRLFMKEYNKELITTRPQARLAVSSADLLQVEAVDVSFVGDGVAAGAGGGFKTDKAISAREFRERELVAWKPEGPSAADGGLESLEGGGGGRRRGGKWGGRGGGGGDWNQFETNAQLFGYKSTWDEDLYTTKLDRNSEQYKAREAEVARIAREIESKKSTNFHVAEERGQVIADLDEEDRYGAVLGTGAAAPAPTSISAESKGDAAESKKAEEQSDSKKSEEKSESSEAKTVEKKKSKMSAAAKTFVPSGGGFGAGLMTPSAFIPQMPMSPPAPAAPLSPGHNPVYPMGYPVQYYMDDPSMHQPQQPLQYMYAPHMGGAAHYAHPPARGMPPDGSGQ